MIFIRFFIEDAYKRRVDIRYYVNLGQKAYGAIKSLSWNKKSSIFHSLQEAFVSLMDVLNALRHDTALDMTQNLLLTVEMAEKTSSAYAKACLAQHHIYLKNYMVQ